MTETVSVERDRTDWVPGPWDKEPDKLNWTTRAGLPGMIVRNHYGALCGYVAVNPDHPLYRKDYDEVDVDVHGGLTYSNPCQGNICHVPEPGQPDDVWWFGFDCHHFNDYAPGMAAFEARMHREHPEFGPDPLLEKPEHYKPVAYVRREVELLAKQLVARR